MLHLFVSGLPADGTSMNSGTYLNVLELGSCVGFMAQI